MSPISELSKALAPKMVEVRRQIHRHPELGRNEIETTQLLASHLAAAGLEPMVRADGVGLVAELGSGEPTVAFRADIDALPIEEMSGAPYASQIPGVMHACGHDAHAAIGLGIATVLSQIDVPGRVRFIFQHAEETFPGGAFDLSAEGAGKDLKAIIAYHVDPHLRAGEVGMKVGPITSSSDRLAIIVEGPGGHTARPHETVDTIMAAARIVTEVPALLQRQIDPRSPVALVFGAIAGGETDNVIPAKVVIRGTCRLLDRRLWADMPDRIETLVRQVAAPTGAEVTVDYVIGIPPVVNDESTVEILRDTAHRVLGHDSVHETYTSMGAEDFSVFLEQTPGALIRLGVGMPERVDLHSARFDIDEDAIRFGMEFGAEALLDLLRR